MKKVFPILLMTAAVFASCEKEADSDQRDY